MIHVDNHKLQLLENPLEAGQLYFDFESEFIADNVRCIPMIARFKLDACGIKLSLKQWSKMLVKERNFVAQANCNSVEQIAIYKSGLEHIIINRTNEIAKRLEIDKKPEWALLDKVPIAITEQCQLINQQITIQQWQQLKALQRFALLKLCKSSHENKNLTHALKEFGLV